MSIWFKPYTLEDVMDRFETMRAAVGETITDVLGIKITEIGENYVRGTMPIDHRTKNVLGIMHGGASCVLAESLGSLGAILCLDPEKQTQVGLNIFTTHIHSVSTGIVMGTARPVHVGRSTHVWEIEMVDDKQRIISVTRLTVFVKNIKTQG